MNEDYFIDTATMSLEYYQNMKKEIERLHSIIKEAREYIREKARNNCWIDQYEANDLIKILDKVGE